MGEVIVITSSVPIHYWYKEYRMSNSPESLDQLYRRINCYILVRPDVVAIYDDGVNENGAPVGTPTIIENELVKKIRLEKESDMEAIHYCVKDIIIDFTERGIICIPEIIN